MNFLYDPIFCLSKPSQYVFSGFPYVSIISSSVCVKDLINVIVAENSTVSLVDAEGREVVAPINIVANQKQEINTDHIASGVYMMKIYNSNFISLKKVVIKK